MHRYQIYLNRSSKWNLLFLLTILLSIPLFTDAQITAGQVDDFNDGTLQNWEQGQAQAGFTNVSSQMQIVADGSGPFTRLVAFNSDQWAGDYITAGVEQIKMKVNNTSASETLNIRLSFGSQRSANGGTWFTTTDVATITAGSGQQEIEFSLAAADMTFVRGTNDYSTLFSNVAYIRIINSTAANSNKGDAGTVATLLVDDITAVTPPATDGDIIINELSFCDRTVELKNVGTTTVDVTDWFLCELGVYNRIGDMANVTRISGDYVMAPNDLLVLEWSPIDTQMDEVGIYQTNAFGSSAAIRDYIQFGAVQSGSRAGVAVAAGVWDDANSFVPVPTCNSSNNSVGIKKSLTPTTATDTDVNDWCTQVPSLGSENNDCLDFILLSEISPCEQTVELFNPTTEAVDVASLWLCERSASPFYVRISTLTGTTTVPAQGYLTVTWSGIQSTDGEVGLYLNNNSFGNAANILDYVQYGAGNQPRGNVAVGAGVWDNVNTFIPFGVCDASNKTISIKNDLSPTPSSGEDTNSSSWISSFNTLGTSNSDVAEGATPFDEATDCDLSDERTQPTVLTVNNGSNTVSGCVQGSSQPGGRDIDYFTFEVPVGSELIAINLDNYDAAPNNLAFIGIQAGATFTEPANGTNVNNLLGGLTYGENEEGTDILPAMGMLGGAIGFMPPLPAGSYTIWMNQTGPQSCYTLDLVIATSSTNASYDETNDGDISDDGLMPTVIGVANGSNTVSGCVQGSSQPGGRDIDYFTFEVPVGSELIAINLDNYDAAPNNLAFIGIQAGATFTEPANGTNVNNLLGGLTYGENEEGTDILPAMGMLGGAIGFMPPLPAGTYTIWMNQTGPQSCYTVDLVISPINDNCFTDRVFSDNLYTAIPSGTYSAANTITTSGTISLAANATVTFEAGQTITFSDGFTASSTNGATFTARIAACTVPLQAPTVESRNEDQVETIALITHLAIQPNPTNATAIIRYELPAAQDVSITVFDLNGSVVTTLTPMTYQNEGSYVLPIDVHNWNTGMYYVVLRTAEQQLVQKLSVVK